MKLLNFYTVRTLLAAGVVVGFSLSALANEAKPSEETLEELPPIYIEHPIKLKKGQTLSSAIGKSAIPNSMTATALHKLQRKYNVRKLRDGQEITVRYKQGDNGKAEYIEEISFFSRDDKSVKVGWDGNKYKASVAKRPIERNQVAVVGEINGSLYRSANVAGLPENLVVPFANLFSWELDFTRDIHPGSQFKVVYEKINDENGNFIRHGNILAAELITKYKVHNAFRYKDKTGYVEYYDDKGINKKRALLRTPLDFARISSHFNLKRKHPILGYTRAHKGTDFAAPRGTPIKASGNGTVEFAGWHGGHGKYIKIRHDGKYKTAYAHLSRYAKGLRKGKKVRQGQIIGYVGSTGRSTGPHLHYELIKHGRHINALREKLPNGRVLPKSKRKTFNSLVANLKDLWNSPNMVAQAGKGSNS